MKNHKNNFTAQEITPLVTVTAEECRGDAEKMVRKFIKKVKRDGIIEECRERQYHVKETTRRAEKKRDKERLIRKLNSQRKALSNPREYLKSRRRRN